MELTLSKLPYLLKQFTLFFGFGDMGFEFRALNLLDGQAMPPVLSYFLVIFQSRASYFCMDPVSDHNPSTHAHPAELGPQVHTIIPELLLEMRFC
jgi:hypothetical protein